MIVPDLTVLSPNYSPGEPDGNVVIVHATRSGVSMNPSEFDGTLYNWFGTEGPADNRHPSAHWLLARDGRKARVVPDNQRAWHAAEDNALAWGIELEQGVESDGFTAPQMDSLSEVCWQYVEMGVQPRHVFSSGLSGFVGHSETAQGRNAGKSDPGSLFDWNAFIASLEDDMTDEEVRDIIINFMADTSGNQRGLGYLARNNLAVKQNIAAGAQDNINVAVDTHTNQPHLVQPHGHPHTHPEAG